MRLKDRIVIVTGGGSGIGQAIAERFAAEGAAIVLAGRRVERLECVSAGIAAAGGRVRAVPTDVRLAADARRMVETAVNEFGRLDILINCAGVLPLRVPLGDCPEEVWTAVIETNLTGVYHCCKAALPALCESRGNVVNIASVSGLKGVPSNAAYSRSMAVDYASRGIRVNAVCPAVIETDLNREMLAERRAQGTYDALLKRHPLGCFGEPADAVNAALFLAGDEARWITGVALPVDGGVAAA